MNVTFTELEELKKYLSDSLGEVLDKKIDPLMKRIEGMESKVQQVGQLQHDVSNLMKNQARALVGWSILCAGVTLLFNQIKAYLATSFSPPK